MSPLRTHSYAHRGGDEPLLGCSVDACFAEVVRRFPTNEAVVSIPQDTRLTYAQFDHAIDRVARGLLALDVAKGDRVGIWSTDNVEWTIVQMATARIGAVLVNINPAYRAAELRHALKAARIQVLVLIPSFRKSRYVEMLCSICPELTRGEPDGLSSDQLPELRHVVVYDPDGSDATERTASGVLVWRELLARGRSVDDATLASRRADLDPDDPINIQFTSGTTGFPKPVVLTHHNILNNAWFVGRIMRFTPDDRLCVPVPFYHCFGMVVSNLVCFANGATVVIPAPHFDSGATLDAIERERCTALHGVPAMFIAELEQPDLPARNLSSLRTGIIGGAPCPPGVLRRIMDELGCREILIGYGQTEASPITHLTRPDDDLERRTHTVGTNLPYQEVKVVDPRTAALCPVGVQGEVCFRGYHVMRGYFEQPAATREAIDDAGWLHSGDLGVMDADGYLRITGRLKDMIIRGGENIYPAEIEAFFHEHPKVSEIAVFGIPDPRLGETVAAWIKLHEGVHAEAQELLEHARRHIAHYKVPAHLWIVEQFPRTVTGKIQKFRMREIATGWLEGEPRADPAVETASV